MKPIFKTPKNNNYFFGYYDKSPVSLDGSKHLAMEVSFINRIPNKNDVAKIGYFDLNKNDDTFNQVSSTKCFNWQQGSMLQWFGNRNTKIIYNDLLDGKFVSIIYDLENNITQVLPMAIYTLASDSKFALCIDNERHHFVRRAYSYDGIENHDKNKNIVEGDGIFLLDIETEIVNKIIDIQQIIDFHPLKSMKNASHYLEHVMLAPDNKRFAFFHRWRLEDGGIYTRLYTSDINGSNIHLLNDSGRMSHFCWNDNGILGWGGAPNVINSLRKYKNTAKFFIKPFLPLYKALVSGNAIDGTSRASSIITGDSYIIFDTKSIKEKISVQVLDRDGHPSFCPVNKNWIVTDTYPDKHGFAQLILFNIESKVKIIVDKLSSIKEYDNSANRCDLHPKWSFDGKYISIDTMNDGVRGIYLYDIEKEIF